MGWWSKTKKEKGVLPQEDVMAEEEAVVTATKWRCSVCGWETLGEEPPELCSLCGAPRENFVQIEA